MLISWSLWVLEARLHHKSLAENIGVSNVIWNVHYVRGWWMVKKVSQSILFVNLIFKTIIIPVRYNEVIIFSLQWKFHTFSVSYCISFRKIDLLPIDVICILRLSCSWNKIFPNAAELSFDYNFICVVLGFTWHYVINAKYIKSLRTNFLFL